MRKLVEKDFPVEERVQPLGQLLLVLREVLQVLVSLRVKPAIDQKYILQLSFDKGSALTERSKAIEKINANQKIPSSPSPD